MDDEELARVKAEWANVSGEKLAAKSVLSMGYSESFQVLGGIMRVAMRRGEKSDRALRLTSYVIDICGSDYTAYEYRRMILETMDRDVWVEELRSVTEIGLKNPKNYQVWHHRRWVVTKVGSCSGEFDFTQVMFAADPKNYHAWAHRLWAVEHFGVDSEEMALTKTLLDDDPRNNSAWNHRFHIVRKTGVYREMSEINFALSAMLRAARNESVWSYLRALLRMRGEDEAAVSRVHESAEQVLQKDPANVPARLTVVHLLKTEVSQGSEAAREEALNHLSMLAGRHDVIRRKYWRWCAARFTTLKRV